MYNDLTPYHHHPKNKLARSLAGSLAVGMPSLFIAVWLIKNSPIPEQPPLIALVILGMAAANFIAATTLEKYSDTLGKLTLPAIVTTVGMVMLFIFVDTFNRFVMDMGYHWLYPPVLAALGLVYIALFRENMFWVKALLAVNAIMLAGLWCLAVADKLALPF